MGWTSPQQLLHNRLDLDSRQGANFKQQQVWPVDECFCALTLVDQFGSLRYLYHQCFSLLSCCQLTYSFHDSMSGRRSQAPRQPPPSWDPHLLLPVLISIGDYILLHACIIALTCMVSCSFLQCLGAQGMPCSRPIATLTPWYPSALPGAPVEGTRLSTTPRHTHLEDHLPSNLVFMCDIFTWYPWHLESWLSASSLYYAEKQRQILLQSLAACSVGFTETWVHLLTRRFAALFGLGVSVVVYSLNSNQWTSEVTDRRIGATSVRAE